MFILTYKSIYDNIFSLCYNSFFTNRSIPLTTNILGVDIGGVIIDRINNGTDTSFFTENYLQTTAVPGVFDALQQLMNRKFGENIYLVSKCGKEV